MVPTGSTRGRPLTRTRKLLRMTTWVSTDLTTSECDVRDVEMLVRTTVAVIATFPQYLSVSSKHYVVYLHTSHV